MPLPRSRRLRKSLSPSASQVAPDSDEEAMRLDMGEDEDIGLKEERKFAHDSDDMPSQESNDADSEGSSQHSTEQEVDWEMQSSMKTPLALPPDSQSSVISVLMLSQSQGSSYSCAGTPSQQNTTRHDQGMQSSNGMPILSPSGWQSSMNSVSMFSQLSDINADDELSDMSMGFDVAAGDDRAGEFSNTQSSTMSFLDFPLSQELGETATSPALEINRYLLKMEKLVKMFDRMGYENTFKVTCGIAWELSDEEADRVWEAWRQTHSD